MAPFDLIASMGKFTGYMVYLLVGLGFGAVLEMSGFGDSRKLAAQFYLKEMTVLKVMFTGIIVAMVLIFSFSSFGLLDFSKLYVNPTYLIPGIIGGLIMGVGFIVGGFCPGTSIVALATFKIDGFFFAGGVAVGVFFFGESVSVFQGFHNATYMGRFILPEWLNAGAGLTVFLVVMMALVMFYWAEISEKFFGKRMTWAEIKKAPTDRRKVYASAVLVFVALVVLFSGQPTPEDKWDRMPASEKQKLEKREIFVHPGELLEVMNDTMLYARLLDIRSETDYNLFHLENARRLTDKDIYDADFIKGLLNVPDNTVVVLMSNNETDATRAYKLLKGQGVMNLYILEGGVNNWLKHFPVSTDVAVQAAQEVSGDALNYVFNRTVGATTPASNPGVGHGEHKITFEKKVKIQKKKLISGGCA